MCLCWRFEIGRRGEPLFSSCPNSAPLAHDLPDVFGGILFPLLPLSFFFFFVLSHEVESEKISNISKRMHVKNICTCSGICSVPLTICTRLCCSSLSQHPNFHSGKFLPLNLTTWLISLVGELDILSQR